MKKKTLYFSILFTLILSAVNGFGQGEYKLRNKLHLACDFFNCDAFGNIYLVRNQTILKTDSLGTQLAIFDNSKNGRIGLVDLSNPLKIMIFHPETNIIQFLDRSLSPIDQEIKLFSLYNENYDIACTSYSNSLWLYPSNGSLLYRIDNQANITSKIELLNQITFDDFKATQLIEYDNFIYLSNPKVGIIILDRWGAIINQIPITFNHSISVNNDLIYYHRQDTMYCYNPIVFEELPILKSPQKIMQSVVTKSNIYLKLANDSIFQYSIW